jgi:hypothetical protein
MPCPYPLRALRSLRLCGRDDHAPISDVVLESKDDRPVAPTYFFLCGQIPTLLLLFPGETIRRGNFFHIHILLNNVIPVADRCLLAAHQLLGLGARDIDR